MLVSQCQCSAEDLLSAQCSGPAESVLTLNVTGCCSMTCYNFGPFSASGEISSTVDEIIKFLQTRQTSEEIFSKTFSFNRPTM